LEPPEDPVTLVFELEDYGPEVYVRAAAAAIESARSVVTSESGSNLLRAAGLLREWIESPTARLASRIKAAGYLTDPTLVGGAAKATRWAVSQLKLFELDHRSDYVEPHLLVEQDQMVLRAIRASCLEWALGLATPR